MKAMKPGRGAGPFHPGLRKRLLPRPEVISALSAALHRALTLGRTGTPGRAPRRPWKSGEKPKSTDPDIQGSRP